MLKNLKFKNSIILIIIVIGCIIWSINYFTVTINERAFLGMDKSGRQIFIQSMDKYITGMDDSIKIDSDWNDFSFIHRLWQEPMRTTFRVYKTISEMEYNDFKNSEELEEIDPYESVKSSLEEPYSNFLSGLGYDSKISMSENYSITIQELDNMAKEKGVVSFRDLLRGLGFKYYEYYINNELKASVVLNENVKNHVEGNFVSTVGNQENKPITN